MTIENVLSCGINSSCFINPSSASASAVSCGFGSCAVNSNSMMCFTPVHSAPTLSSSSSSMSMDCTPLSSSTPTSCSFVSLSKSPPPTPSSLSYNHPLSRQPSPTNFYQVDDEEELRAQIRFRLLRPTPPTTTTS